MDTELSDIDSIVNQSEMSSNNEIPMESHEPVESTPPPPQEYEYRADGQTYKANIEKLLGLASRGHSAPNRIGELSKKLSDYENRFKQFEQYEKSYKPVDEWAKANPDKWNSLVQSWQQAQYGAQPPQPGQTGQGFQLPPEVIQKLQSHDQFIQQVQQKEIVQREQAADQGLDSEIASIRKANSNIDFDAPDQNGRSLEYQILEHATRNGIPSFRAAFRDYCFPQLTQFSQEKGRGQSQGVSPQTKAALLGKNPASAQGQMPDLKNRNYDQIHEMILQSMGLS